MLSLRGESEEARTSASGGTIYPLILRNRHSFTVSCPAYGPSGELQTDGVDHLHAFNVEVLGSYWTARNFFPNTVNPFPT